MLANYYLFTILDVEALTWVLDTLALEGVVSVIGLN